MPNLSLTNVASNSVRDACTSLSIAFANAVDSRNYPRVLELFTEDAVLQRWDQDFVGREGIAGMLNARPVDVQTRHICSNIEISQQSANEANGITYFVFFRGVGDGSQTLALGNPNLVGEYHDRYLFTDVGWRIAQRRIKLVFSDNP
jgi:3-phenylpropionate/cinnamic acid dioxygenase small subunit